MNALEYRSFADAWEERATIRTRPRRRIEDDQRLIYPLSRQPLVQSATFQRACPQLRDFVLVQSLYKFINDVVIFETEIVDRTARRIAKDRFTVRFPFACRYDAMTVVVDEDYHALVAMDFLQQTIALTGLEPIALPTEIELSRAIPSALAQVPEALRDALELICVGIAENTLTDDVAAFARDDTVKPSVKGLMADHLLDEGRHSSFWARLTRIYWQAAPEVDRQMIAQVLPVFLGQYLTNDIQQAFDFNLIEALPVNETLRQSLREEVLGLAYPINHQHPLLGNILRFFRSSSMLESPCVQEALRGYLP
ncbi:diiron oxygenase [Pseudomonas putida]|uniref:diiron oxygenase n=1 Tax=Pseudomonas putida TaxID=303 RepID=UPI00081908FC|nr:diiron oxygenase [Pseudomonas putida]OCT28247.1 aminobenzoate oxygenase [Pseudomonas putida]OCT32901.1 aminobenzoate oxygenase [Pseudomonas putida]OCT34815.1 aminobenzoate oxygenase [Pseudomonas putida]OCT41277.1 aminobenzoate oxygenase [Pseudomonas putida]